MNTVSADKIDQHFRLIAAPALALLIIAVVLGYFAFVLDQRLQSALPFAEWPLLAKGMHYIAPWLAVSSAFCAVGLCANSLGERALSYFTSRPAVFAALVASFIAIILVVRVSFAIVETLLAN